jgi:phage/conjugal plasmid C-4 type zinc finger TraR family protein
MDEIDRAQLENERHFERSMAAHHRHFAPLFEGDEELHTAKYCLDCGAEIPVERRRLVPGTFYCVVCQSAHEKRDRLYGEHEHL